MSPLSRYPSTAPRHRRGPRRRTAGHPGSRSGPTLCRMVVLRRLRSPSEEADRSRTAPQLQGWPWSDRKGSPGDAAARPGDSLVPPRIGRANQGGSEMAAIEKSMTKAFGLDGEPGGPRQPVERLHRDPGRGGPRRGDLDLRMARLAVPRPRRCGLPVARDQPQGVHTFAHCGPMGLEGSARREVLRESQGGARATAGNTWWACPVLRSAGVVCHGGPGTSLRFAQNLSPSTAF